jgi:CHAD domain-containing protein
MKRLPKIRCDRNKSAAMNARAALPRGARAYFAIGRQVVEGKPSFARLHRLRLETKRFRYTLEVFAPIYGPSMGRRLQSLRQLQDYLGHVNDCATIRDLLLQGAPKKTPPALKALLERLDRETASSIREFLAYWKNVFDAPGQRDQWIAYLGRFAGRRKKTK